MDMEASRPTATENPNPNPRRNLNSISSSSPVWPTIDGPLGLSEEDSINYARRFYNFGFLLLPLLWAVNCFYFWPVLRHPRSFPRIYHSCPDTMFPMLAVIGTRVGLFSSLDILILTIGDTLPFASDVVRSAVGFMVFSALLSSWALTFSIGGERLFGPVWDQLVMYNLADKLGLTAWS